MAHVNALNAVVAHGQTIRHLPAEHLSWQLLDPWPIHHALNVPVCWDLRQADLIAGGHGAPITPLSDWIMYRHATQARWIVNLGGICNITYLPAANSEQPLSHIRGMDIGPCNLLLDGLLQLLYPDLTFDEDGKLASQGTPGIDLLPLIRKADFFKRPLPRTTGREDFDQQWVTSLLAEVQAQPNDLLYAAVDAVARQLADEVTAEANAQIILAGGGSQHPLLVQRIREYVACPILLSDELSIPVTMREAIAMAILGALCEDGIPITLPQVTGSKNAKIAGSWIGYKP
jgi:1,6-anhydro-N-acetylmuramate kinase